MTTPEVITIKARSLYFQGSSKQRIPSEDQIVLELTMNGKYMWYMAEFYGMHFQYKLQKHYIKSIQVAKAELEKMENEKIEEISDEVKKMMIEFHEENAEKSKISKAMLLMLKDPTFSPPKTRAKSIEHEKEMIKYYEERAVSQAIFIQEMNESNQKFLVTDNPEQEMNPLMINFFFKTKYLTIKQVEKAFISYMLSRKMISTDTKVVFNWEFHGSTNQKRKEEKQKKAQEKNNKS